MTSCHILRGSVVFPYLVTQFLAMYNVSQGCLKNKIYKTSIVDSFGYFHANAHLHGIFSRFFQHSTNKNFFCVFILKLL